VSGYSRKAKAARKKYQFIRMLVAVGSLLVPIMINLPLDVEVIRFLTTVIGLLVAISVVIEGIFHFKENWMAYNNITQYLDKEWHFYTHKVGRYCNLSENEAFKLLVENVETELAGKHLEIVESQTQTDTGNATAL